MTPAGGFFAITAIFGAMLAVGLYGARFVGRSRNLTFRYIMVCTTIFCMWLMWAVIYLAHMFPLIRPVLQTHTG